MGYAPKIVLQLPISDPDLLPRFVEACIRDGVALIAIAGEGCTEIEEMIDVLVVGDGSEKSRFLATSSHAGETIEEVMEFASMFDAKARSGNRLVRLKTNSDLRGGQMALVPHPFTTDRLASGPLHLLLPQAAHDLQDS
jgi:hypothetical protein